MTLASEAMWVLWFVGKFGGSSSPCMPNATDTLGMQRPRDDAMHPSRLDEAYHQAQRSSIAMKSALSYFTVLDAASDQ
jgi:hypothetical protein